MVGRGDSREPLPSSLLGGMASVDGEAGVAPLRELQALEPDWHQW